ncbi:flagellar hook-basal body complex protein [Rhizobium sp. NTR19]|uniref:Flagellar hook protein FlgE n=1 Tax=Neorhizobium turbinariae TaxID=2937795 RepID=A0ABT0INL1_9HYPH|nr:flagellar hook-basal body complex protein [Neorhizobium turbinariae]MCK8779463.1 flagellar hook-basal body complex protein [Neorhizobium turbinariae]
MSLFGAMNSSVSGMKAQSNRLGTTSDNIVNASTAGYKRADTAFSTLVMPHQPPGGYSSGGVETTIRRSISEAGSVSYTNSPTDIAIVGNGFFVVEDADGTQYLTRAGNFQKDAQGHLLNSGGYRLAGYDYRDGEGPGGDLVTIDLSNAPLIASASTVGTFNVNVPIEADQVSSIMVDTPPSENGPSTRYTKHLRMTSTPDGGVGVTTDIYFTKLPENKWEVTSFVAYGSGATGFPYDLASGDVVMASTVLTFDPITGKVVDGNPKLIPDPADDFYYDFSSLLEEDTAKAGAIKLSGNFISDTRQIDRAAGEVPPSANVATSVFTRKDTYSGYAGLPSDVAIDMYSTKVGENTWEVAFFNQADSTAGGFPYGEPGSAPLAKATLTFDPATGSLADATGVLDVEIPGIGSWSVELSDIVSKPASFSTADGMSISLDLARSSETIRPHLAGSVASQNQVGASTRASPRSPPMTPPAVLSSSTSIIPRGQTTSGK